MTLSCPLVTPPSSTQHGFRAACQMLPLPADNFSRSYIWGPFSNDWPPVADFCLYQGQRMGLNAWISFPPYSKDTYFLFEIHTNMQRSAGWNSPAVALWLAMKKWLIVAVGWSNIYYLFTFRVIPSGSRQSTNKRRSCGTAVQNRTWIIDLETWEAPAGLRVLNIDQPLSPCLPAIGIAAVSGTFCALCILVICQWRLSPFLTFCL